MSLSPAARANDHAAAVANAAAATRTNSMRHRTGRGSGSTGRRGGFGGGGRLRRSRSPGPSLCGVEEADAEDADGVVSEMAVPVSLIDLVVHADQRRAPLRMFHFADALPSLPPPPPPPPAHNTPSPRIMRPRLSARGRDCAEVGLLSTTTEGVAATAGGGRQEDAGRPREGAKEGAAAVDEDKDRREGKREGGSYVRHCATCEALPVVCIDDEKDATSTEDQGGRQCGLTQEGDLSANEQVRAASPAIVSRETDT